MPLSTEPMRLIKFQVSLAGNGHAYQIGEEHELVEWLAIAYCSEPEGDPRAVPVGWDLAEAIAERKSRPAGRRVDEARETREELTPPPPAAPPAPGEPEASGGEGQGRVAEPGVDTEVQ